MGTSLKHLYNIPCAEYSPSVVQFFSLHGQIGNTLRIFKMKTFVERAYNIS